MTISQIMEKMIKASGGNIHDIHARGFKAGADS